MAASTRQFNFVEALNKAWDKVYDIEPLGLDDRGRGRMRVPAFFGITDHRAWWDKSYFKKVLYIGFFPLLCVLSIFETLRNSLKAITELLPAVIEYSCSEGSLGQKISYAIRIALRPLLSPVTSFNAAWDTMLALGKKHKMGYVAGAGLVLLSSIISAIPIALMLFIPGAQVGFLKYIPYAGKFLYAGLGKGFAFAKAAPLAIKTGICAAWSWTMLGIGKVTEAIAYSQQPRFNEQGTQKKIEIHNELKKLNADTLTRARRSKIYHAEVLAESSYFKKNILLSLFNSFKPAKLIQKAVNPKKRRSVRFKDKPEFAPDIIFDEIPEIKEDPQPVTSQEETREITTEDARTRVSIEAMIEATLQRSLKEATQIKTEQYQPTEVSATV